MKTAKILLRVIGVWAILLAGFGLWYNSKTLFTDFSQLIAERPLPHFYPVFYTMSGICILCYLGLLVSGIQFLRLRTDVCRLFVGILIFEILYFISAGPLWLLPVIGTSIGASTGIANGGMMFQTVLLFPLWAPFAAVWASRKIANNT